MLGEKTDQERFLNLGTEVSAAVCRKTAQFPLFLGKILDDLHARKIILKPGIDISQPVPDLAVDWPDPLLKKRSDPA